jgi:hypothetical protein
MLPVEADVTWDGPHWKGARHADGSTIETATVPPLHRPQDMIPLRPSRSHGPSVFVDVPQDVVQQKVERQAQETMEDELSQLPAGPIRDRFLQFFKQHPVKFGPATRPAP